MHGGINEPRRFDDETGTHRIDGECPVRIAFARIDSSPGSRMHNRFGLELDDGRTNRIAVGDVEVCMIETSNLMTTGAKNAYKFVANLTTSASDENSHQRAFKGSHQARLARYHSTVSATATSRFREGFHPRSLAFEQSME